MWSKVSPTLLQSEKTVVHVYPLAWDIAVTLMECGEVAKVKSAARFAYGERGKGTTVPPHATITYELELLEVREPANFASMTEEELTKIV